MQNNRTTSSSRRNAAARAGSVWETRMRIDEMKHINKVFNGDKNATENDNSNNSEENGIKVYRRLRRNQSSDGVSKRKSWKPPEPPRGAAQLRKTYSALPTFSKKSNESSIDSDSKDNFAIVVFEDDRAKDSNNGVREMEIEDEISIEEIEDKEIDLPLEKSNNNVGSEEDEEKEEKKKFNQIHELPVTSMKIEKKLNSVADRLTVHSDLAKLSPTPPSREEVEEENVYENSFIRHNRMDGFVDLIMWRDISKSALVFGFGTFFLLSTSYTKDINFSFISAISYLGLVYLAIIFLYKSILRRGAVEIDEGDEMHILGEQEAIWLVNLVLPYINEILLKMRALFSGDPATTMKLAALLFVLARCGNSITMWTLAKLVFFGAFTVPKIYSSYSCQLARYGKFWLERFRDGWESCTHKKAVAAGVFTLIWNLSSTVARAWAVFMLIVVVRFYQQCMVMEEEHYNGEEHVTSAAGQVAGDSGPDPSPNACGPLRHRHRYGPTIAGPGKKLKK